jgi:hypothetical protein
MFRHKMTSLNPHTYNTWMVNKKMVGTLSKLFNFEFLSQSRGLYKDEVKSFLEGITN